MERKHRGSPTVLAVPGTQEQEKTVVVLGAFRGGTSLLASVLRALGVYMGDQFPPHEDYPNQEDQEFVGLLHRGDFVTRETFSAADFPSDRIEALKTLIARRNRGHRLWGWKYPGTVVWLLNTPLASWLRNPHFITIFRDPLAVFQYEADVGAVAPARIREPGGGSFHYVAVQYQRLQTHLSRCQHPHLLVSYEMAKYGEAEPKRALVDSIIRFLEPALENPQTETALQAIKGTGEGMPVLPRRGET